MAVELVWEPPGEGDWWLVREHFPYAVSRMFSSLFPVTTSGWKTGGARYGLAIGEPQWASLNGWIYYGPRFPLTSDELDQREIAAAATLASSPWRPEVRRWHEEERPQVVDANRALQAQDPASLDDAGLIAHFQDAVANYLRWAPLHFEHGGFDVVAGLFFVAADDWGLDRARLPELLAGASPASSAVDAHLRSIALELARADAPLPTSSMAEVREASKDAAAALDAYLDEYGWRPVAGHDLLEPTFGERPALVVAAITACRRRPKEPRPDVIAEMRAAVPLDERDRFDSLLADVRASYALRDDDVGVCWNWPIGLIRRAGLEMGRRLVDRGRLVDQLHLFEAEADEAVSLIAGQGPTAAELAVRWDVRARAAVVEPPVHLDGGGERLAPVSLPPNVARLTEIRDAVWSIAPTRVDGPLHGVGIGSRVAAGTARVVRHHEELTDLVEGDVLVTIATTTSFNAVFPLLAAVVTEQGGLFSHAAVLSRELDLPAVLGVPDVFESIHDGDLVEVDPLNGAVRVVDRAG
jgi:pyruvate,water dikinase